MGLSLGAGKSFGINFGDLSIFLSIPCCCIPDLIEYFGLSSVIGGLSGFGSFGSPGPPETLPNTIT